MDRFRQEPLNQTTGGLNHFADRGLKIEHKGLSVEGKNSCPFAKFAAKSNQKSFLYMRVQIFKTLSDKAAADALHIAIVDACRRRGYEPPVICTPEELMEV